MIKYLVQSSKYNIFVLSIQLLTKNQFIMSNKSTAFPIPDVTNYEPFPKKDDGYITRIHAYLDNRPKTSTYIGKLSEAEIKAYVKNEYCNCEVFIESVMYYKYEETKVVNLKLRVS